MVSRQKQYLVWSGYVLCNRQVSNHDAWLQYTYMVILDPTWDWDGLRVCVFHILGGNLLHRAMQVT